MDQTNTKRLSLQERLDQMGALVLDLTPGADEHVETIFQGVGILTQSGYPLWRLKNILTPVLEKFLPDDGYRYDALVYGAAQLLTSSTPHIPGVSAKQRDNIAYELLYELLIAPFLYLDAVLDNGTFQYSETDLETFCDDEDEDEFIF